MSRGIGGNCRIVEEDEHTVIYEYGGYNLNKPEYRNADYIFDGIITIEKSALVEPEIHTKIKRTQGGQKKLVTKRVPREVPYMELIESGKIGIQNCSNCWRTFSLGKDMIAYYLLFRIFDKYQEDGFLPSTVSYNV